MFRGTIQLSEEEVQTFGYWSELASVSLDEDTNSSWIMAMPYGTYQHPLHGELSFTPERAKSFSDNIKNNVRGQELDIDYDHKARTGEAAGWVKDAEVRPSGLFVLVEWTEKAYKAIKTKAYKYFSPEFVDSWTHPQSGKVFQDVMFGGALTNRPFLKGILPINLSELTGDDNIPQEETVREWLEKLAASLGIEFDEDTSDEDLQTSIETATQSQSEEEPKTEETSEDASSEDVAELAQLAESSPAVAKMLTEHRASMKRIETLEAANTLSEVSRRLSELDNSKVVLAPAFKTKLQALAQKIPVSLHEDLFSIVANIMKDGVVQLGEQGRSEYHADSNDALEQFPEEVRKLQESNGELAYLDAVERVAADNPELFAAYREATTIGGN